MLSRIQVILDAPDICGARLHKRAATSSPVLIGAIPPVLGVLMRGREHVSRPGGWCQLCHWTEQGALSAIGACTIDTAVLNIPAQDEAVRYLFDAPPWYWKICKWWRGRKPANIVASFNDRPGRTQEEIVVLF